MVYKDANLRNFLLADEGVALVDFDDLTLAPFGYDLAKLIITTAGSRRTGSPPGSRTNTPSAHSTPSTPPRLRVRQTADIVGTRLRLTVTITPDLRGPDHGEADGKPWHDIKTEFGGPPQHRPDRPYAPGSETWNRCLDRATNALQAILDQRPGQRILIVGHGETIEAAHTLLLELPQDACLRIGFVTDHACLARWQQHVNRFGRMVWMLAAHNDTAHLETTDGHRGGHAPTLHTITNSGPGAISSSSSGNPGGAPSTRTILLRKTRRGKGLRQSQPSSIRDSFCSRSTAAYAVLMRRVLPLVVGIVAMAIGAVWTFQGLGYLGGSAMTDERIWAVIGPIVAAVGVVSIIFAVRSRRRGDGPGRG